MSSNAYIIETCESLRGGGLRASSRGSSDRANLSGFFRFFFRMDRRIDAHRLQGVSKEKEEEEKIGRCLHFLHLPVVFSFLRSYKYIYIYFFFFRSLFISHNTLNIVRFNSERKRG